MTEIINSSQVCNKCVEKKPKRRTPNENKDYKNAIKIIECITPNENKVLPVIDLLKKKVVSDEGKLLPITLKNKDNLINEKNKIEKLAKLDERIKIKKQDLEIYKNNLLNNSLVPEKNKPKFTYCEQLRIHELSILNLESKDSELYKKTQTKIEHCKNKIKEQNNKKRELNDSIKRQKLIIDEKMKNIYLPERKSPSFDDLLDKNVE